MPFIDNLICFCGTGMVESMLEPHLKSAGATQMQVGLTFFILGGVYMFLTPVTGYVCKSVLQSNLDYCKFSVTTLFVQLPRFVQ